MFEQTPTYMNNTVRNLIWPTLNLRFPGQLLIGSLSQTLETRLFAPNKYHIPCTSFLCTCWNSTSSSIIDRKPSCTSLSPSCTSRSKSTCGSVNFSWVWIWSWRVAQVTSLPVHAATRRFTTQSRFHSLLLLATPVSSLQCFFPKSLNSCL